jgi:5-bromo-4-chloroindolyl phosphate hydrolysis protein
MVNRKEEQGDEAIKKIKKEAGDNANIEWIPCDMGDLKQTKETFTKIRSEEKRLDLVGHFNRSHCVSSVNISDMYSWFYPLVSTQTSTARRTTESTAISK